MRFGRRSRLSDFGVTLAILLTVGIAGYAGLQIYELSHDIISGFFKPGPVRTMLAIPNAEPTLVPTAVAVVVQASSPAPSAAPTAGTPVAKPTSTSQQVKIGNTNGDGVYIRRTPKLNDRLVPWPDNTTLEVVGEDVNADGVLWKKVKDPRGNIGYVPAQYITPVN